MNSFQRFINPVWPVTEKLQALLMPWKMSISDHLKVINDYAYGVAEKRREQLARGEQFKDLLSRFMSARNEKGEALNNEEVFVCILKLYSYLTLLSLFF